MKRRAPSRFAVHPDVATHELREAPADDEAEPGSPELTRRRTINLAERLEQPAQLLTRDANARIGDLHMETDPGRLDACLHVGGDGHPTLLRELDRVTD